jgi:predicted double-glycine peptidase
LLFTVSASAAHYCSKALTTDLPRHAQQRDYTCGAACMRSLIHHLKGVDKGEPYFANLLGTYRMGLTTQAALIQGFALFNLRTRVLVGRTFLDLYRHLARGEHLIVGWMLDGSSPHYSVVKSVQNGMIELMDPWAARGDQDRIMSFEEFSNYWRFYDWDGQLVPGWVMVIE